ncbi:MAG: hypothetical protein IPO17_14705 [Flavobacteriales bacterium]|nr:hypothetical protein [Flavobacteriales bacterium]
MNQFSWTAQDGTFWMFGGQDNSGNGLAALWKYDPATNMWTWMKGPSTFYFLGSFGTQGIEDPANLPPAKTFGGASWVDLDGNFWMYGGENGDNYDNNMNNDLWRYNPGTNNWTWMKGTFLDNPPAVWGSLGVPDINNQPPARNNCYGTWVDDQGDLWMFGGAFLQQPSDDLWRYTIATNTWTWMNGSQTTNALADYGTMGMTSGNEHPGRTPGLCVGQGRGRPVVVARREHRCGLLWLGRCLAPGSNERRVDMDVRVAEREPCAGRWHCVRTEHHERSWQTIDQSHLANTGWTHVDLRIGVEQWQSEFHYSRNDLWTFCPATLTWTLGARAGRQQDPAGGTLGVAAPTNRPNGRSIASAWVAQNGDLYLFGGNPLEVFATYGESVALHPGCYLWCVQRHSGGGHATMEAFSVAPNPVCNGPSACACLPAGQWSIDVLDVIGRRVLATTANCSKDLSSEHLPNGSYVLVARSAGATHTAKLLITH